MIIKIYSCICFINIVLALFIQQKTEKRLAKAGVNVTTFKNCLDNESKSNDSGLSLSFSYCYDFLELIIYSCCPLLNAFSMIMFIITITNYNNQYESAMKVTDSYIAKRQLKELQRYDDDKLYERLYSLITDKNFEYRDVIIKSLKTLMQYIDEYENIKTISKEDDVYKKELLGKLKESINKFKNMAKELSYLYNQNNYSFDDLERFNSLLDNITSDIKSNKAIFIK